MSSRRNFLKLSLLERAEALQFAATAIGKSPRVLEKDLWVCWCLEKLFSDESLPEFVFKGGTSLSKVFGAIDRFSEDIDITISGEALGFSDRRDLSNAARDRELDKLQKELHSFAKDRLVNLLEDDEVRVELDHDSTLWLHYPSCTSSVSNHYLRDCVKVELGARNPIVPAERHFITADIAEALTQFTFPRVTATVLSPSRTFWEKATILHLEYHRPESKPTAERIARHYYDLSILAKHSIGKAALEKLDLLEEVAADKKRLFRCAWANYDQAKPGSLRLAPLKSRAPALEEDFNKMIESGMFPTDPLSWIEIVEHLTILEAEINRM